MKKVIAIVGPTATGKSELGIKLARKFSGEIISADSRAIYKHLSIGTAKPPGKWSTLKISGRAFLEYFVYKGIKHHMVDFLDPEKTFSAFNFATRAQKLFRAIKLPIVVGGTGFWIDALFNPNLLGQVGPNKQLRRRLEKKTVLNLFRMLKKLDPSRAKTIQKQNKRRLIRALEIAMSASPLQPTNYQLQPPYGVLWLGLTLPNLDLKKKIRQRFMRQLKQGLIKETRWLIGRVTKKRLKEIGLMYPIIVEYINGSLTKDEMIERSVNSIYHYAKRQKTWFKRNKEIHWISNQKAAARLVSTFLKRK